MTDQNLIQSNAESIDNAATALDRGGLVILPTDTVYGIGASVSRPDGVTRLYIAKGRPLDRAIPVLVSSQDSAYRLTSAMPEVAETFMRNFWPGPLTIVVPAADWLPEEIVRDTGSVGIRMPAHRMALQLIEKAGGALAVTSANLSGKPETCNAQDAADALGHQVDVVLDGGRTPGGVPSTVVKVKSDGSWMILRVGAISSDELRATLSRY